MRKEGLGCYLENRGPSLDTEVVDVARRKPYILNYVSLTLYPVEQGANKEGLLCSFKERIGFRNLAQSRWEAVTDLQLSLICCCFIIMKVSNPQCL